MKPLLTRLLFFFFAAFGRPLIIYPQVTQYNFRHLTSADGLSDGEVHAITQDKYGFIWIGTTYGLNRFDGMNVKTYFWKRNDSNSLTDNYVRSLFPDKEGRLWIGTLQGLCRFNEKEGRFIRYGFANTVIDIKEDKTGRIWVGTQDGLWKVDEGKKALVKVSSAKRLSIRQIFPFKDNQWLLATDQGIKVFDPITASIHALEYAGGNDPSLLSESIHCLAVDASGNIWAVKDYDAAHLFRISADHQVVRRYDHFADPKRKWTTNTVQFILNDDHGNLWMISSYSGISLYNEKADDFEDHFSQPQVTNSLLTNSNVTIYQDRQGIIWVGSPGYGISYFNPSKEFFSTIYPEFVPGTLITETWCRAACEDRGNNLWLATAKGLLQFNRPENSFRVFANTNQEQQVIQYNSVRTLLLDDEGDIWIGTSKGLNRYHPATGKMDFFTQKQGMPLAFFWMIVKDKNGTVWLGSASGLYRYDRDKDRFDDLSADPILKTYAHRNIQALYADRWNHLWIGALDLGLINYDINKGTTQLLRVEDSLLSDTRFSSFAEDQHGKLWIGAENGLTAYDPGTNHSEFYTRENGLPSDRTNNIMVDSLDRIWVGTSNGLCMLNAGRDHFTRFDSHDGLMSTQFNEQAAFRAHDGSFIYPTYRGFLVFDPEEYRESNISEPLYITSFSVSGKKLEMPTEEMTSLHLRHDQNFFSLELAGLNFMNPYASTYAYKLEPLNKDWVYTNKRDVNYTNVPAGRYKFHYKVLAANRSAIVQEKTLVIEINQVVFKTWWFRAIVALLLVCAMFAFYTYRSRHREKILLLKGKAQLLEKEKTLVMYESLKQQLNPHFLFNSLTSLRGLIKNDPGMATHFLDGMSKVYRYVLKSGEQELMPLGDELEFVKTFADLQKTRFGDGLLVNINVDSTCLNRYIAPVILQNLVENAIKHNTTDKESPLVIDIYDENGYLVVRNNLQRYRIVETSNKKGLASLQSLYRFLSDKPIQVTEDVKYFTVKIPLL